MEELKISGNILARNTILNLIGRTIPLIVGIITIPLIVRGLGTERFGLLSLIWVVLGYFSIFDLGLGRATTKYVAEIFGKGETNRVSDIVWTSVTSQAILGIIGTVIVVLSTPLLVESVLNISPTLHAEARVTFYVLALSVPIILISSSFSGVLEATQRFDLINAVKIPTSILTFLLPVIGLSLNFTLPGIVGLILTARIGALISFMVLNFRTIPQTKKYSGSLSLVTRLLSFGGWITVSNIIGPLLQYLDRFLIGALLTMGVVAYYTAPFDIMSRLSIIPLSLVMTMFPAFSTLGLTRINDLRYFFIRSTKYMFLFVSLVTLILILFAHEILQVWLGDAFAKDSTLVLQILALGILISSLTHLALALFQGIGHPDITAKIQLLLLPVSIFLSVILIKKIGIIGAALSWTISRTLGMLLSWKIAARIIQLDRAFLVKNRIIHEFVWFLAFTSMLSPLLFLNNIYIKALGAIIAYNVFSYVGWRYILDTRDRTMILGFLNRLLNIVHVVSKKTASK